MGAWDELENSEAIACADKDAKAQTATILADPGETIHFDVLRTDGHANNNEWRCQVLVSTDPDSRWSDPAIGDVRLPATKLNPNFAFTGYYAYSVQVYNDANTTADVVAATVFWRKDNVNI